MGIAIIIILAYIFVNVLEGIFLNSSMILSSTNGTRSDFFGSSVAMDNRFVVIGTFKDDVGRKVDMGSVTVFSKSGNSYKFERKIIPYDGEAFDYFGFSVALSNNFLLIGSMQDETEGSQGTSQGSAYFYQYNGSGWYFQQKVLAEKVESSVQFGVSVAIDGDIAVIGGGSGHADGYELGACHVFHYDGNNWSQKQMLSTVGNNYDNTYGTSVAIRNHFIVLGVSYVNVDNTQNAGMVYLYKQDTNNRWVQHTILNSTNPVRNGWFGRSVSMDHKRLVIGAEGEDSNKGNSYVYISNNDVWTLEAKLKATNANYSHHFGFAVSIDQDVIVIGAFKFKSYNRNSITGVPYVFKLTDGKWREDATLLISDIEYDLFGRSLAVFNETVVVGIYAKGIKNGSAYLFNISQHSFVNNNTKHISTFRKPIIREYKTLLISTIVPSLLVVLIAIVVFKIKGKLSRRREERDEIIEGEENIGISSDDISLIANTQA